MDILKRIAEQRQREEKLAWEGTFAEYLEMVRQRPELARTSHARVYHMIADAGVEEDENRKQKLLVFQPGAVSGWNKPLNGWWRNISIRRHERLDVRKRILLLMGPVSGGKSTIVTMLKKGLEAVFPHR